VTGDEAVRALLRRGGAETIDHPGGTLFAHLVRVSERLAGLGAATHLRLAGLAHAVYGTDGFDVTLLPTTRRAVLRDIIGHDAELLVYRYGACDRKRTWRTLAETRRVRDRFTGVDERLSVEELRPFVDLTVVNEIDVLEHSPAAARRHGAYLWELFESWAPLASPPVLAEARRSLGHPSAL
jgi:hypothetical protein